MRKGSLQLSINAIVVLVLAITMLGMGLAFTKGKFAELGARIEVPEPDYPATPDDPVVLGMNEIKTKAEKSVGFSINFYNEGLASGVDEFYPCLKCNGVAATTKADAILDSLRVQAGDYEPFRILIPAGSSFIAPANSGKTLICEVQIISGSVAYPCSTGGTDIIASKQITLKVR